MLKIRPFVFFLVFLLAGPVVLARSVGSGGVINLYTLQAQQKVLQANIRLGYGTFGYRQQLSSYSAWAMIQPRAVITGCFAACPPIANDTPINRML